MGSQAITRESAEGIFRKYKGTNYKEVKRKGDLIGGSVVVAAGETVSWEWTKDGRIPPRSTVWSEMRKYPEFAADHPPRSAGGKGGKKTAAETPKVVIADTDPKYWEGRSVEDLDRVAAAVEKAKASRVEIERTETAKRAVRALETLGLPVSEELTRMAEGPQK